jgi:ribosome-associated protein
VVETAKAAGFRPLGTEGARDGEWVLVDLQDVLVHVMLPRVREFYGLESLWDSGEAPAASAAETKSGPKAVSSSSSGSKVDAKSRTRRTSTARRPATRRPRPAT